MQFHSKEKYIWQIYMENLKEKDILISFYVLFRCFVCWCVILIIRKEVAEWKHVISSPHYNLKQTFSPHLLWNPSLEKEGCQPKSIYKDIFDLKKNMSFYIKYFWNFIQEREKMVEKGKFLQNVYFST